MSRGDVTQMPQSINTQGQESVPGVVVSVDDPENMGRVKVRSMHAKNIPDDKLPWVHVGRGGNQSYGGMGSGAHAYKPGMMVSMSVPYADQQSAQILGPYHQPGAQGQGGTGQQLFQNPMIGKSKNAEAGSKKGGSKKNPWTERHKTVKIDNVEGGSGVGPMAGAYDKNPTTDWNAKGSTVLGFYKPENNDDNNKPAKFSHLPTFAFKSNQA